MAEYRALGIWWRWVVWSILALFAFLAMIGWGGYSGFILLGWAFGSVVAASYILFFRRRD